MNESLQALVETGLAELGIEPTSGTVERLAELARCVEDWGRSLNLTGHRDAEAVTRRLVLDAAALVQALPRVPSYADLGSGAGFPGLPIAILDPDATVVLVEARERRHHFQRHVVRSLGLENVRPIRGRIEEAEPVPSDLVLAQAVAPPGSLVEWMRRWAVPGGLLAVPGGTSPRKVDVPDLADARNASYQVPLGGPTRTVWIARLG